MKGAMDPWYRSGRLQMLTMFACTMLVIFAVTRVVLMAATLNELDTTTALQAILVGVVNDLIVMVLLIIPVGIIQLLMPWRRWLALVYYVLVVFGLLFIAVAEYLFWDEFSARFNFISVDYLVYRREVTGNIMESYPVFMLLAINFVLSLIMAFLVARKIGIRESCHLSLRSRLAYACALAGFAVVYGMVPLQAVNADVDNRYARELGFNGVYQFFHAFRANELNYREYYLVRPDPQMSSTLHSMMNEKGYWDDHDDPYDVTRVVENPGPEHHKNVMLVVVESLSAKYVGFLGNEEGLTPHLDALAKKSLHFDNFYATGTRTVRGLEAISLSIPPTPGRSIVKRPDNQQLFSIGSVFKDKGYDARFLYGGFGYFDNMNAFFGANDFQVVDRASFAEDEITFANIWGVADEDLYDKALKLADESSAKGKPFFSLLMTTSNHRPYTYPGGRIDIPSGTGRRGAVKYTDHAINELIEKAKTHDWFDDTVFVIVADHTAGAAGKTELDPHGYRIPLLIYSPGNIQPGAVDVMASQMDLAPTLLALLGFDYRSRFFGRNVLSAPLDDQRALIANYQRLGLLTPESLAILSPKQEAEWFTDPLGRYTRVPLHRGDHRFDNVVAWYEGADYVFHHHLNRDFEM